MFVLHPFWHWTLFDRFVAAFESFLSLEGTIALRFYVEEGFV